MTRIAFIGLGNMGRPMALNLKQAGHDVVGFDVFEGARAQAAEAGLAVADTLAAAVAGAEAVITMLPAGPHVAAVWEEGGVLAGLTDAQAVLIDCSTIDVATSRRLADLAAARGLALLDAPVSGGIQGAGAGTLTFMVGGDALALERARPYLEIMGRTIVHAGGPGTGQAAKLCNNMMLGIQMLSVCEGLALAERLGLDPARLYEISATASAQCWSLTTYCPWPGPVPTAPSNNDYKPGFAAAMMLKDLGLAHQAAEASGALTPLGALALERYQAFIDAGNGDKDFSAVIQTLRQG